MSELGVVNNSVLSHSNATLGGLLLKFNPYEIAELITAILAVVGNGLVILVFYCEKRMRTIQNYQIISLAVADFLIGLVGIPIALVVRKF